MGVAIVSGCGLRVKWTSPIDLLGQKTLGLIPYLLFLCEYEFIHVKFEIFPRSSKGRGHRLHRHITFFPPKFFLIYRPYWSQITSQTFYTQMIVRLFGQIQDYKCNNKCNNTDRAKKTSTHISCDLLQRGGTTYFTKQGGLETGPLSYLRSEGEISVNRASDRSDHWNSDHVTL